MLQVSATLKCTEPKLLAKLGARCYSREWKKKMALHYHIRETSTVTDEVLQRIINEEVAQGWNLDGIQFALRDSSKRPSMAFIVFTREAEEDEET